MQTDFFILCAETVPDNYTWDLGTPLLFAATTKTVPVTAGFTTSISGYAPAVNVIFFNNSISDTDFNFIIHDWNFGDYYHDTNNTISLSCASLVQHTYIMPGTYTVSLRHYQSKGREELDQTGNSLLCRGKYGIRWFWDELGALTVLSATNIFATTWNETSCNNNLQSISAAPLAKWWDNENACFQKYCKAWSWYDLATNRPNPVKWIETESDQVFQKKWMLESNETVCTVNDADFLNTTVVEEQTVIKTFIVNVKELMPTAGMHSVSATTGTSPFTVQLTPRGCVAGSFPIERIDWSFGDGSPIKTITRYAIPSSDDIVYTGAFPGDVNDVRNIDVLHTYIRNKDTYSIFYPTLTCYSACTNSSDSCSITIGPVSLPTGSTDVHILKARNTLKGNVYTFADNNKIALTTTTPRTTAFIAVPTIPTTTIRDTRNTIQIYFGHANNNIYPPIYIPDCTFQSTPLPDRFITTEDPTPFNLVDNLVNDPGVPVTTEVEFFIIP